MQSPLEVWWVLSNTERMFCVQLRFFGRQRATFVAKEDIHRKSSIRILLWIQENFLRRATEMQKSFRSAVSECLLYQIHMLVYDFSRCVRAPSARHFHSLFSLHELFTILQTCIVDFPVGWENSNPTFPHSQWLKIQPTRKTFVAKRVAKQ